jgi:hypothetical protein
MNFKLCQQEPTTSAGMNISWASGYSSAQRSKDPATRTFMHASGPTVYGITSIFCNVAVYAVDCIPRTAPCELVTNTPGLIEAGNVLQI